MLRAPPSRHAGGLQKQGSLLAPVTGLQLDLTPFTATLWAQFLTQRSVHPSRPRAAIFSRRMLWEMGSKALLKARYFLADIW